mgnify:CR=1 FL=1
MLQDEHPSYPKLNGESVIYLAYANFNRLVQMCRRGSCDLSKFESLRDAILFQYDDLPELHRKYLARRLQELADGF